MTKYGYTLFCEGYSPGDLIKQAIKAEDAGFDFLVISDHYHPWLTNHEHSAFAWSVLGALTQVTQKIGLAT
jgi:alkanesulfonate monooxygenase SsuD/methylene tetrahydromethanopterin reductase-like flavin-dependent oxidoreductase (luciferase family)